MEKTLKVLNQMVKDSVVEKYVIAGAIAATFYIEPIATFDLDVVVAIQPQKTGLLTLEPIYHYLKKRGYAAKAEAILVEGWPVQFLPSYNALIDEAMSHARAVKYRRVSTNIFTAEYLAAIMLQTGRNKDYLRLVQFCESKIIDQKIFNSIVKRYQLQEKWHQFQVKFLEKN